MHAPRGKTGVMVEQIGMGGEPADGRAGQKSDAKGRTDDAHAFGAIFPRGHVRDRGDGHGEVAAHDPAHDAADQENGERPAERQHEEAEGIASNRHQQHRPPAHLIGSRAPDGGEDELGERIDRAQRPGKQRARARVRCTSGVCHGLQLKKDRVEEAALGFMRDIVAQQRRAPAGKKREADQVDVERQEDDAEGKRFRGSGSGGRKGRMSIGGHESRLTWGKAPSHAKPDFNGNL